MCEIYKRITKSLQEIKLKINESGGFPFQYALFDALAYNKDKIVDSFVEKLDLRGLLTQYEQYEPNKLSSQLNWLYNKVCKIASICNN